jgi:hypothetical protein
MNKRTIVLSLLGLVLFSHLCLAEDAQTIVLKDGSQIKGNLSGVSNGVYTITTPTMGDVKISAAQVASISTGAPLVSAPAAPPGDPNAAELNQRIEAAQSRLMSDPAMMQQLAEMLQDPEIAQIIQDPQLAQLVMSRDVKAIEANPKAKKLMENPKIRALMEQLRGSLK